MIIPRISDALGHIDDDLITEAEETKTNVNRKIWIRLGAVAASLILLMVAGTILLPSVLNKKTETERYKDHSVKINVSAVVWPWEYRTIYEKYTHVVINETEYSGKGRKIAASWLDENLGTYSVSGLDETNGKTYEISADVYGIRCVSSDQLVAVKLDEEYYVFRNSAYLPPRTLGELLEYVSLPELIKLEIFSVNSDQRDNVWYKLRDDRYVWDILASCIDAKFVENQEWLLEEKGNFISFAISSEALGVYKQALYVTDDGYVWTNAFDWQYLFYIGTEATGKIISYAKENTSETEYEPYMNTITGTITEITDKYIIVDDAVLCKNPENGVAYKILLNDTRVSRYFSMNLLKVGDVVQVSYTGTVAGKEHTVSTAVEIDIASVLDGKARVSN